MPLTFKGAQLLTGHGNLRGFLSKHRLRVEGGECECEKGEETGEHLTEECEREDRLRVREFMREQEIRWSSAQLRRGGKMCLEWVKITND